MKIFLSPRRMVRVGGNEIVAHSFNIALCDPLLAIVCPFISCWMLPFSFCTNESFCKFPNPVPQYSETTFSCPQLQYK